MATTATTKTKTATAEVITLKVTLSPRVWRRILIRSDQTLDDLQGAIEFAFDREEHGYEFVFPGRDSSRRLRRAGAKRYVRPFEDGFLLSDECDATTTTLAELGLVAKRKFQFVTDSNRGTDLDLEVLVESARGDPGRLRYPRITDERGKSPEQYPVDEYGFPRRR